MLKRQNDPLGLAISNYYFHSDKTPIKVNTNITLNEEIDVSHFFREFEAMPKLEKIALKMVKGNILDVGAGAGAHSLYLQNKGFDTTAIDISILSCKIMSLRGIKSVKCVDIYDFNIDTYDTIMFLMNGIGLVKTLEGLEILLIKLKNTIKPHAQILLDSSDIKYMFEDDYGALWIDTEKKYYGDLDYSISYKENNKLNFSWLFVSFEALKKIAIKTGWKIEHIYEDNHFHFLARLSLIR